MKKNIILKVMINNMNILNKIQNNYEQEIDNDISLPRNITIPINNFNSYSPNIDNDANIVLPITLSVPLDYDYNSPVVNCEFPLIDEDEDEDIVLSIREHSRDSSYTVNEKTSQFNPGQITPPIYFSDEDTEEDIVILSSTSADKYRLITKNIIVISDYLRFNNYLDLNNYLKTNIYYNNGYYNLSIKHSNYMIRLQFRTYDKVVSYFHYKYHLKKHLKMFNLYDGY